MMVPLGTKDLSKKMSLEFMQLPQLYTNLGQFNPSLHEELNKIPHFHIHVDLGQLRSSNMLPSKAGWLSYCENVYRTLFVDRLTWVIVNRP